MDFLDFSTANSKVDDFIINVSDSNPVQLKHDIFYNKTGKKVVISTGVGGGGTVLTETTDWVSGGAFPDGNLPESISPDVGYTTISIVNSFYHSTVLYVSFYPIADVINVEKFNVAHPYIDTDANLNSDNPTPGIGRIILSSDNNQIAFGDDSTSWNNMIKLTFDNTNQRLGINTKTPQSALSIVETASGNNDADIEIRSLSTSNTTGDKLAGSIKWYNSDSSGNGPEYVIEILGTVQGGTGAGGIFTIKSADGTNAIRDCALIFNNTLGGVFQMKDPAGAVTVQLLSHASGSTSSFPKIQGAYDATTTSTANLNVDSAGNIKRSTASTKRVKNNIRENEFDTSSILNFIPYTFNYNIPVDGIKPVNGIGKKWHGFIAEDLEKIDSKYVNYGVKKNGEIDFKNPIGIHWQNVCFALTCEFKKIYQRMIENENRLNNLENKLNQSLNR